MPWTPLHAALGEVGMVLDFDLIGRACDTKVTERSDLDWKQRLPLTADPDDKTAKLAQQAELAKDIAAMANSGGGMIVYGVAESRIEGTSAANYVVPVGPVSETTIRAIRQVAGNLIYPPVTGTELFPVAAEDALDQGVLVLLVPDSPEAPHLIHQKNADAWFGVPYRHGPDTEWMVERQIATAYPAREVGRRRRIEEFDERFDRFVATCGEESGRNWIVAMAVPETPVPRPRDLELDQANRIIEKAWRLTPRQGTGPRDLTESEATRRGLQRYVRTGQRTLSAAQDATLRGRIEVHGDGAVAVGFTRDGAFIGEGRLLGQVAIPDIEQTALDLFALLWATRQALGVSSGYIARISVTPPIQIFRRRDLFIEHYLPFDETQRVFGYGPVDGPILMDAGLEVAVDSWVDLIRDAVNQTGVVSTVDPTEVKRIIELNT